MRLKGYLACIFLVTALAAFLVTANRPSKLHGHSILPGIRSAPNSRLANVAAIASRSRAGCDGDRNCASPFSLPMTIEANEGQADPRVKFIARGKGITALLTTQGIEVVVGSQRKGAASRVVKLRFGSEVMKGEPISGADQSVTEKTSRPRRRVVRSTGQNSLAAKAEKQQHVGRATPPANQEEVIAASNPPKTRGR